MQIIKHHFVTWYLSLLSIILIHPVPLSSFKCSSCAVSCLSPIIIISHTSNGIIAFRFVFSLSRDVSQFWWRSIETEELCWVTFLRSCYRAEILRISLPFAFKWLFLLLLFQGRTLNPSKENLTRKIFFYCAS